MDYNNAKMWAFNNITIAKDESNKIHSNKTNTIQARSTRVFLMVLVQMHVSESMNRWLVWTITLVIFMNYVRT
jgi:hypothetical protein